MARNDKRRHDDQRAIMRRLAHGKHNWFFRDNIPLGKLRDTKKYFYKCHCTRCQEIRKRAEEGPHLQDYL